MPRHMFKAYGDVQIGSRTVAGRRRHGGVELVRARQREQPARGRTASTTWAPDRFAGYAVVNLGASYRLRPWVTIVAQVGEPVRPPLRHVGAARADGVYRHGRVHRPALPRGRRRVSGSAGDVRRARGAGAGVGQRAFEVPVGRPLRFRRAALQGRRNRCPRSGTDRLRAGRHRDDHRRERERGQDRGQRVERGGI